MQVEPDTKIVQSHFRGQTRLKSRQVMRTFTGQTEGIQEFVIDCFDDLPNASQPAPQRFGPAFPLTCLMRRADHLHLLLRLPALLRTSSRKSFIRHICSTSYLPGARQTWCRVLAGSKQGRGQHLIMSTGRSEAKTGNHPVGIDAQQQVEPFIPADAIAPANVGLPGQPAGATAFGITGHRWGTIQDFIETLLGMQKQDQIQPERRDSIPLLAQEPIELAAIRQLRKGRSQMMLCIAIKGPFAGKLDPLAKQRQGDHLASLQRSQRPRFLRLLSKQGLAKIIYHHVQCSQERIQIDHQRAPFLTNWFVKLTVRPGSRSFQVLSISHQTFKKNTYYYSTYRYGTSYTACKYENWEWQFLYCMKRTAKYNSPY